MSGKDKEQSNDETQAKPKQHQSTLSFGTVSDQDKRGAAVVSDQEASPAARAQKCSPVSLTEIQELLAAKELCAHRVWQREVFTSLKDP